MRLLILPLSLMLLAQPALLSSQQTTTSIEPPPDAKLAMQLKGEGVQIYSCTNQNGSMKWTLKAPDAKLMDSTGKVVGMHFAGPTWKLTDGSQVQGVLAATQPAPEQNSVPWLLLAAKPGTGAGKFSEVSFIRRTETHGGVAPKTGCEMPSQAGATTTVPYSAAYSFYSK